MGETLSQAEIDALLKSSEFSDIDDSQHDVLTSQEIDALGEIGNISMGTSATTLFTLIQQKVLITTPKVSITTWNELESQYNQGYVAVKVEYTHGLVGTNLLLLKDKDVMVITDLMMGGDGTNIQGEINDLHLSAVSEAMNQMIGSAATSMSSMFNKRIEISPPKAFSFHFASPPEHFVVNQDEKIVCVAFRMVIGELVDSEIMQLMPVQFAKDLVYNLLNITELGVDTGADTTRQEAPQQTYASPSPAQPFAQPQMQQPLHPQAGFQPQQGHFTGSAAGNSRTVDVRPMQFESFEDEALNIEKKNISLIMDVPLEVTVELGRTHKPIKEILEFGAGSIIELDKLAGEPVDILVNGKPIAKGEVVVIDENFGVRITDIIQPSKRL